jgi:hypothetical protein
VCISWQKLYVTRMLGVQVYITFNCVCVIIYFS